MFKIELPYKKGTFVKVSKPLFGRKNSIDCGTVVGYSVFDEKSYTICISGYKESWFGEYMPEEIEVMTDEEIAVLKKERGEKCVMRS